MKAIPTLLILAASCLHMAAENASWLRYPAISPDGHHIAFSYKGDIFIVGSEGGEARQLTSHPAHDYSPVWSPDGKTICFASDRHGNFDLHTVPAAGGRPYRITTHSADERPWAFTPDGRSVVFSAQIHDPAASMVFPKGTMTELYSVGIGGGRPEQILATPAEEVSFAGYDGTFVYQDKKGGENIWRKHHRSSITRDIWLYKDGKHTRLTDFEGEDREPVVSADGKTLFYLSEAEGGFNVYSCPIDDPQSTKRLTRHKIHPVRFLSMSDNGTLCYGFDGDIYVMKPDGSPARLDISILADDSGNGQTTINVNGGGDNDVSADGSQIAFINRGEVFVASTKYKTTNQITHTAAAEADVTFSPDGKKLAYASERDGAWNIYTAELFHAGDVNFANATLVTEKALFRASETDRKNPSFSPDGKELAYIEGRQRLMVLNLASGKTRQITDGSRCVSTSGDIHYKWSPDGKWFTLSFRGNANYAQNDVGIVSADGKGPIHNITESGYWDVSPTWVLDGNAILFKSDRYGRKDHARWNTTEDVMIAFLNREAHERFLMSPEEKEIADAANRSADNKGKGSKDISIELDGISDRIERLTPLSADISSFELSKDGSTLYYLAQHEDGRCLWTYDVKNKSHKKIGAANGKLRWTGKGKTLYILGSRFSTFRKDGKSIDHIGVRTTLDIDHAAEREAMFNHVYRQEKVRFYRADLHGVDWEFFTDHYRKFLPHINNNRDFAELLSEYLGELNVSHTGARLRASKSASDASTARLGLFFDHSWDGNGLKVEEALAGGPFDSSSSGIEKGDIISHIDGVEILRGADYYPLLDRKAGRRILVGVKKASGETVDMVVVPIDKSEHNALLYDRWVKRNAETVDRLSGGRLGYVHIKAMNDNSFRHVYSEVLGKHGEKEGVVIDTRFNGGGGLHEDLEILFSGEQYFAKEIRGKFAGMTPGRRFNQPSIMVVGEANYSNAHGTPWMYKDRGLGKLVGMPVPGTMTSVIWETLQNPSLYFGIPVTGHKSKESGEFLENNQLYPDIMVENDKCRIPEGVDQQIEAAVRELLKDIDSH